MARNQTVTVTGAKGKKQATTDKKEVFTMANINMEELVSMITKSVIATLSQVEAVPTKATTKKATTKKATTKKVTPKKSAPAKVGKPNPVKERIEQEQKELALVFGGKEYGSKTSNEFIAFYRKKDNGSYTRLGHFNTEKGLFWFTKKSVTFKDWAYIKAQLTKYSNAADFVRNSDRFKRAGIKCPSDFGKVSWETFLTSGIFC